MRRCRMIALLSMMTIWATLVPAFAQQETDPTWYDPWASVTVHRTLTQSRVAKKEMTATATTAAQPKVKKVVRSEIRRESDRKQPLLTSKAGPAPIAARR
jgi:hypothetical protein